MKLLSKTTLLIVTVSIFIFLAGNIVFFFVTKQMIKRHIDAELISQMHKVMGQLDKHGAKEYFLTDELILEKVEPSTYIMPKFSDTVVFSNIHKKYIPYRSLTFTKGNANGNYKVQIHKSLLASDKLIERITILSLLMVLTFIAMIYVLNRFVFVNVWSDFFNSLKCIASYDVKKAGALNLDTSEIEEFQKLNNVLNKLVERIQTDYRNLKDLTANTSHEIQTPLAIIKNKAELLLQSPQLVESDYQELYQIINTADRLSKLNSALLLITKIENNQFEGEEHLDLGEIMRKHLNTFEMLFETGGKKCNSKIQDSKVIMNPILLDVLISNLLNNALLHSKDAASVFIELKDNILLVKNEGEALTFNQSELFKRFVKTTSNAKSNGIGLEIVHKICLYYEIPLAYNYMENHHCFTVDFNPILY